MPANEFGDGDARQTGDAQGLQHRFHGWYLPKPFTHKPSSHCPILKLRSHCEHAEINTFAFIAVVHATDEGFTRISEKKKFISTRDHFLNFFVSHSKATDEISFVSPASSC